MYNQKNNSKPKVAQHLIIRPISCSRWRTQDQLRILRSIPQLKGPRIGTFRQPPSATVVLLYEKIAHTILWNPRTAKWSTLSRMMTLVRFWTRKNHHWSKGRRWWRFLDKKRVISKTGASENDRTVFKRTLSKRKTVLPRILAAKHSFMEMSRRKQTLLLLPRPIPSTNWWRTPRPVIRHQRDKIHWKVLIGIALIQIMDLLRFMIHPIIQLSTLMVFCPKLPIAKRLLIR